MPLHFASTMEIAAYLLDCRADIDARDVDHESTGAQYRVRSHPEIARLSRRGCRTPLGWAIHGSEHGPNRKTDDYAGTVEALLEAGANPG